MTKYGAAFAGGVVWHDAGAIEAADAHADIVIIGAGACGLVAALAARDAGATALVIERDASPSGSTALSSGFVPACGTRWQRAAGVEDSIDTMASDILAKAKQQADSTMVRAACEAAGPALEWLYDRHGIAFELLQGFSYPGHSALRMHAVPERSGAALVAALVQAAETAGVDLLSSARATHLHAGPDGRVLGLDIERPGGQVERLGCAALVLACNGYGGNREMVAQLMPEMREALYFGHAGNQGDAVRWGAALGAALDDLGAYQGHGSVAEPHGILMTWALVMQGAIQVNQHGQRFSNETEGYSEQSVAVLAQPGRVAYNVHDARLLALGREFPDFREAEAAGAVIGPLDAPGLAARLGLGLENLDVTLAHCSACARGEITDPFGRDFTSTPALQGPYYATRVTGALFHTQGGLRVDPNAQVLRNDDSPLPNLFAGGGAARGVSGPAVWGYLSGNGLLTAVTLGRTAGQSAARSVS